MAKCLHNKGNNNMKTILKVALILCVAILLSGCFEDIDDTRAEVVRVSNDVGEILEQPTSPTPITVPMPDKSGSGFAVDEVREFDGIEVRFMSYTFDMKGEINWDGERYWTRKCHGWTDDHRMYAYIVCNDYETECFIALQHGYGSTNYDYVVSDRMWNDMISKSIPSNGENHNE